MSGVKNNDSHSSQHCVMYAIGNFIRNIDLNHMTPPQKHVRMIQHFLRQTALRHILRCSAHLDIVAFQKICDCLMDSVWIKLCNILAFSFMLEFIPHSYMEHK